MAAFERAVRLGYRYLETDVQATRDGIAVVFHDRTLDRMTGFPGRVNDALWSELALIRTLGGEPMLRLDDLLGSFPELYVNIEPKSDQAVVPMTEAIRRCNATSRTCVGSFNEWRTQKARALLGQQLCWSPSYNSVARLWLAGWGAPLGPVAYPAVQVPPRYRGIPLVTRRFVAAAHARSVEVHVWTVDEAAEMERLLELGVDGLMTDCPTLLKEILVGRGQWSGG